MYIEQTNPHMSASLLYCSLFIAPTCFNVNTSYSGSSHLVPAKLHKRVHAVWWSSFSKLSLSFFRVVKILKHYNCLSYNELYCNNFRKFSQVAVYKSVRLCRYDNPVYCSKNLKERKSLERISMVADSIKIPLIEVTVKIMD